MFFKGVFLSGYLECSLWDNKRVLVTGVMMKGIEKNDLNSEHWGEMMLVFVSKHQQWLAYCQRTKELNIIT